MMMNKKYRKELEARLRFGESNSFMQGKEVDIRNLEDKGEERVKRGRYFVLNV